MNSVADVWDNVLQQLKGELSETTIATWFDELEAVDIRGNTFFAPLLQRLQEGIHRIPVYENIKPPSTTSSPRT